MHFLLILAIASVMCFTMPCLESQWPIIFAKWESCSEHKTRHNKWAGYGWNAIGLSLSNCWFANNQAIYIMLQQSH